MGRHKIGMSIWKLRKNPETIHGRECLLLASSSGLHARLITAALANLLLVRTSVMMSIWIPAAGISVCVHSYLSTTY